MIVEIFHFTTAISIFLLLVGFYAGMMVDVADWVAKPALWCLGIGITLLVLSLYMLSP
jgi:hypothetical protein